MVISNIEINLATLIQDRAAIDANAIAVLDGARKITFGDFAQAINDAAHALAGAGVGSSMKFGIEVTNPYDHWVAMFAMMRLGGISVTLLARDGMERARQADIDLVLSANPDSRFKKSAKKFIYADDGWATKGRPETEDLVLPDPQLASRSLGRIVFSSGTTGTPKGILIRAQSWAHGVRICSESMTAGSKHYNAYGIESRQAHPLATWAKGGSVVLKDAFRGRDEELARAVTDSNHITTSSGGLVRILGAIPGVFPGKKDRVVRVGGAALRAALRDEALARLCGRIEIAYASMELGVMAQCDGSLLDLHPGAVGVAIEGVEVQIIDAEGRETPPDVTGEIRARSPFMATGYLADPAATGQFFRQGWFYPGDLGFKQDDGLIVILGRDSDVLNIGGAKYSASEIEQKVLRLAAVNDACALAVPNERGRDVLVILVILGEGVAVDKVKLEVGTKSAPIKLGNFVLMPVEEIPRNQRGKISRPQLVTWVQDKLRS